MITSCYKMFETLLPGKNNLGGNFGSHYFLRSRIAAFLQKIVVYLFFSEREKNPPNPLFIYAVNKISKNV